jgi:hypothetical protein
VNYVFFFFLFIQLFLRYGPCQYYVLAYLCRDTTLDEDMTSLMTTRRPEGRTLFPHSSG